MIERVFSREASTTWLHQKWLKQLRTCTQDLSLDYEPVPVRGWMHGRDLIACVRFLGGETRPATPFHHWTILHDWQDRGRINGYVKDLTVGNTSIGDFTGIVTIELDGIVFLALRVDHVVRNRWVEQYTILAGPSLEDTLRLADRLSAALSTLAAADVGLCGSHIREICHSAALFATDGASDHAEHLEREFRRMVDQHEASRRYGQQIASPNDIGFKAGRVK